MERKGNRLGLQKEMKAEAEPYEDRFSRPQFSSETRGGIHGGRPSRSSIQEVERDNFVVKVARELNHAFSMHDFHRLILVAPPDMLGELRLRLDGPVQKSVWRTLHKDLAHATEQGIMRALTC